MAQPVMQTSFHAGEWTPALNARVDLAKYRSGAAVMENFFVDYRGGASTRPGTRYVLHAYKADKEVRLIPFQASFDISFMLEFGDFYIRFIRNGALVLEAAVGIVPSAPQLNPLKITTGTPHGYVTGDWIFLSGLGGMTQVNGRYFKITVINSNEFLLSDLFDQPIDGTAFGTYTSGGIAQRIYTIPTPYSETDLRLLKYAQNVDFMVICHPNHDPYTLTFNALANWALVPITFGTTVATPTGITSSSPAGGTINFSYRVTAVDENGQESGPTANTNNTIGGAAATAYSITVSWNAVDGAVSYNVYRSGWSNTGAMPAGSAYGLVANIEGTQFVDNFVATVSSNPADYSLTPPLVFSPFLGGGVTNIVITAPGNYSSVPNVSIGAPSPGGTQATATAVIGMTQIGGTFGGTGGFSVGDLLQTAVGGNYGGVTLQVTSVSGSLITGVNITNPGAITSGSVPGNPLQFFKVGGGQWVLVNVLFWGLVQVPLTNSGSGYLTPPLVSFDGGGGGSANANISAGGGGGGQEESGNPTVPLFFQQRLVLAGPTGNPQKFNMSQPGSYFNFNESRPIQPDDAIEGFLVSGQLNSIKSMVNMSGGLIMLSDKQAWLIKAPDDGGVTPINITATGQAYNGAGDLPPIVINYDILYVQSKGSIVRDLTFNFYTNIYTGVDVTVLSSHLFYGHTILAWAYAEEPYKVLWAVRNDGVLLSLTFLKEQELVGWAHSETAEGDLFKSVGSIVETVPSGTVDALYLVVERDGIKYIERMAERTFENGVEDAWCVDSGLRYEGLPASTFTGAEHLRGRTVTGLADGEVIAPFVMPMNGTFTLSSNASKVTVGLGFTATLQTLALDLGEPTVQGKRKKVTGVTLRCQDALGLSIGRSADAQVVMKDLVRGNVGSMTNQVVTDLVTGDARTNIDPLWDVPGQYVITQPLPLPATILGVIPEISVGDAPK